MLPTIMQDNDATLRFIRFTFHKNTKNFPAILPLRTGLTEKGWHTLSVQMPVLGKGAKYYDYVPIFPYSHERIDAAINFYKANTIMQDNDATLRFIRFTFHKNTKNFPAIFKP
jgi:hypothetical protein